MDLLDFLPARIAEDEATAKAVEYEVRRCGLEDQSGGGRLFEADDLPVPAVGASPERVLAECEAKRRIVDVCGSMLLGGNPGPWPYAERILRSLALPYADHPEYHITWGISADAEREQR